MKEGGKEGKMHGGGGKEGQSSLENSPRDKLWLSVAKRRKALTFTNMHGWVCGEGDAS